MRSLVFPETAGEAVTQLRKASSNGFIKTHQWAWSVWSRWQVPIGLFLELMCWLRGCAGPRSDSKAGGRGGPGTTRRRGTNSARERNGETPRVSWRSPAGKAVKRGCAPQQSGQSTRTPIQATRAGETKATFDQKLEKQHRPLRAAELPCAKPIFLGALTHRDQTFDYS